MPEQATIVINYDEIIYALGEQIQAVWSALKNSDNEEIVREISNIKKIEISDEQNFITRENQNTLEKGTLYIVVKFGIGATNYGSSVAPVSLYCLGTENKVRPSQFLLGVFASTWTTKALMQDLVDKDNKPLVNNKILQVWNTPEIINNFNETNLDFRNLFRLSGNVIVGSSAIRLGTLTYYWGAGNDDYEVVNVMSFQDNFNTSMDTQPFGNIHGFTKSEANFSSYTFSVSTFLLDNHLSADSLAVRGFRNRNGGSISSTFSPNDRMKIKLEFTNGFTNVPNNQTNPYPTDTVWGDDFFAYFKIVNSQIGQEIAGIPTLLITFAR